MTKYLAEIYNSVKKKSTFTMIFQFIFHFVRSRKFTAINYFLAGQYLAVFIPIPEMPSLQTKIYRKKMEAMEFFGGVSLIDSR